MRARSTSRRLIGAAVALAMLAATAVTVPALAEADYEPPVLAIDPQTGQTTARAVTAVYVNRDSDSST